MTDSVRHYVLEVETASFDLSAHEAELAYAATLKTVEKNWKWLSAYGVITLLGWIASYFTNQWACVALSVAVSMVTFCVGLWMIREVVTTKIRIR